LGEIKEIIQVVALFVVTNRFYHSPGYALGAGRRVDATVGTDRE
jgi:hypothetical protein